jgi:hypothetical protein
VAGLALSLAPVLGIALDTDEAIAIWLAPALAAFVAVAAAAITRIRAARRDVSPALLAASIITVVAGLPALVVAFGGLGDLAVGVLDPWDRSATASRGLADEAPGAVLALTIVAVALVAVLALLARLRRFAAVAVATGLVTALAAAVLMPTLLAASATLLAVAIASLASAATAAVHRLRGATSVLAATGIPAVALAWMVGHTAIGLWWWVVPAVFLSAVAGRILCGRVWRTAAPAARVLHVLAASVVAMLGILGYPGWAGASGTPPASPWDDPAFLVALVATIALAGLAFARRLPHEDRLTAGAALFTGAVLAAAWLAVTLRTPFAWVPALILAAAGLVWVRSDLPPMRLLFASSTPLALGFAGAGLASGLAGEPVVIGLAIGTLAAAVVAHVATPDDRIVRLSWSLATGMLTIAAILVGTLGPASTSDAWVVLLLLTPVPILLTALFGDPIGGDTAAPQGSWGTLVLGVGSVWAWFGDRGSDRVEAYTLPLAAGLLIAAALIMWRRTTPASTAAGRTAVLATAAVQGSLEGSFYIWLWNRPAVCSRTFSPKGRLRQSARVISRVRFLSSSKIFSMRAANATS